MKRLLYFLVIITSFANAQDKVIDLKPTNDVYIQDQSTDIIDLYLFAIEDTFSLESDVVIDDTSFVTFSGHSITIGDVVCFQEGTHVMQALTLDVDTDTITIDSPFDFAFTTSGGCSYGSKEMNVDGSVTPVIFRVGPGNLNINVQWDITRIMFAITDAVAMDDGKFGGISALTRGIVLRVTNSKNKNIFNIKSNGDFALRSYNIEYTNKAPAGENGFRCRRTFAGQQTNGVTIRVSSENNDQIQLIIRDDLTDLTSFNAVVQGHVVD